MFTAAKPAKQAKPKTEAYLNRNRDQAATRQRLQSLLVSDIAPLPKRDKRLWRKYRLNLLGFLIHAFPHSTGLKPFSAAHVDIIHRIQKAAIHGGLFLQVVYRGFAKSTITENAVIWACCYGHSKFVVPITADA